MSAVERSSGGLPTLHSLWIGPELSYIERLCLASMLEVGHRVVLHSYEPVAGVPAGVELADANDTLEFDEAFRERQYGSVALFSDYFRAVLLSKDLGAWIDLDVFCLRPLEQPESGYMVGWERSSINGAVLRLPPECPVLQDILESCRQPHRSPSWLDPRRRYLRRAAVVLSGRQWHLSQMGWGIIGPIALTRLFKRYGMLELVQPMKAFYPVDLEGSSKLYQPEPFDHLVDDSEVKAIHIYDKRRELKPVPGSFMHWATQRLGHRLS